MKTWRSDERRADDHRARGGGWVCVRVVAVYAVVGALWILFSDRLMIALVRDAELLERAAIAKGWFFVAVTSALLYGLLKREFWRWEEQARKRRDAESALRERDRDLERAHEIARLGRWSLDLRTGLFKTDERGGRVLGVTAGEHLSADLLAKVHPDDLERVNRTWAAALADGVYFTEYRSIVDHVVRWVHVRAEFQQDKNGVAFAAAGTVQDVTAVKASQTALRESEERFRQVVENIDEVFWLMDVAKSRVLYVSPRFEQVWGRPLSEAYDSAYAMLSTVYPADRARVKAAMEERFDTGNFREEYRIVRPDGSIRWVRSRAFPVRDERGRVVNYVGMTGDFTERKNLEEQFLRAQRLEAIGTLAGGVAHDLNNILSPILMSAGLLQHTAQDERDIRMLKMIEQSANRGAEIVKQLLTLSRGNFGDRASLQLRVLVKEMAGIMRETFPRNIELVVEVPADLPPVIGDATQIHQVLMNLCVNARDAMPEGGRLEIIGSERTFKAGDPPVSPEQRPGRFVCLAVTDTGGGISPENLSKIFDPFFTTKPIGQGTGLGLPTVLSIVKGHDGFITVESREGQGTRFAVYLPAAKTTATAAPVPVDRAARGSGQLILLIDDEPAIRTAARSLLERQGYLVITAVDGREALQRFEERSQQIALVLTDVMMPVMGGTVLVQALRKRAPTLPIIATTGMATDQSRMELLAMGVREILQKPCTPAELLGAVGRALAPAEAAT